MATTKISQRPSSSQKTKSAVSTKHTRNAPLLSEHSNVINQQSSFVSESVNQRANYSAEPRSNQRSHSIPATGYRTAETALTPKSAEQQALTVPTFDNRERRPSQGPLLHQVNVAVNLAHSSQKRSGSVTANSNSRHVERNSKLEMSMHDPRYQSINHDIDKDLFSLVQADVLSQSMCDTRQKLKSTT